MGSRSSKRKEKGVSLEKLFDELDQAEREADQESSVQRAPRLPSTRLAPKLILLPVLEQPLPPSGPHLSSSSSVQVPLQERSRFLHESSDVGLSKQSERHVKTLMKRAGVDMVQA
mmetsp:Transcript_22710/g.51945  ORF Transcript_22710/g.51945 Transcript_22710/m.51945 type:complete len:115 (-) Transcript_22710:74-418(-)